MGLNLADHDNQEKTLSEILDQAVKRTSSAPSSSRVSSSSCSYCGDAAGGSGNIFLKYQRPKSNLLMGRPHESLAVVRYPVGCALLSGDLGGEGRGRAEGYVSID